MRSKFDSQLALLNTELIRMGALCEEAHNAFNNRYISIF